MMSADSSEERASLAARRSASVASSGIEPGAARRTASGRRWGLAASTASRHAREAPTTRRPVAAPAPRRATPPQVRGVSSAGPSAQPSSVVDRRVARSSAPARARPLGPDPARSDRVRSDPFDRPAGRPVGRPDDRPSEERPSVDRAPDERSGPPEREPPPERPGLDDRELEPPDERGPVPLERPAEPDALRPGDPGFAADLPVEPPFALPFEPPFGALLPVERAPPRGPLGFPERDELEEEGLAITTTYRAIPPAPKTSSIDDIGSGAGPRRHRAAARGCRTT